MRSSVLALLLIVVSRIAHAQPIDSVGVRAQGMGGAFTAVADDATATWWNPAGLASSPLLNVSLEYGQLETPETGRGGFAFGIPSLGLSYYHLPVSEIQPTSSTAESGAVRQDPGTALARTVDLSQFGVTVGQSIGNHLVLASTLKIVHIEDGTQVGLDIGAMAIVSLLRLGVSVKNLREPTLGEGPNALTLRRQVRAGVALSTVASAMFAGTVAFDADVLEVANVTGNERRMAVGGEVWFWNHVIGARAGYGGSTVGEARTSTSFGGSVMVHRGMFVEGQLTRGSDMTRHGWEIGFRLTF